MYDLSASMIGLLAQKDPDGVARLMAEQGLVPPAEGARPMTPLLGDIIGATATGASGTLGGVNPFGGPGVPTAVPGGSGSGTLGSLLGGGTTGLSSMLQGMAPPEAPKVDEVVPSSPAAPRPDAIRVSDALLQLLLAGRSPGPVGALGGLPSR